MRDRKTPPTFSTSAINAVARTSFGRSRRTFERTKAACRFASCSLSSRRQIITITTERLSLLPPRKSHLSTRGCTPPSWIPRLDATTNTPRKISLSVISVSTDDGKRPPDVFSSSGSTMRSRAQLRSRAVFQGDAKCERCLRSTVGCCRR